MIPVDVYVCQKEYAAFKRRAVAAFHNKKEYMEALFIRRGVGEFHVERFIKLRLTIQKEDIVDCEETQYNTLKEEAKQLGLEFGTIHTHVYGDSAPSEWDHKEGVREGETLVGVCYIWKDDKSGRTKTRLDFWQPQLPANLHVVQK